MLRKIIGVALIATPICTLVERMAHLTGWKVVLTSFAISAVAIAMIVGGLWLLIGDKK